MNGIEQGAASWSILSLAPAKGVPYLSSTTGSVCCGVGEQTVQSTPLLVWAGFRVRPNDEIHSIFWPNQK
ncbi:MAG TPA: hypothetical protein VJM47_10590 [Nitrosospira sp.]|jgi:hypothetical protein|nr:hypothetical protein [Nitrosospira sp.]